MPAKKVGRKRLTSCGRGQGGNTDRAKSGRSGGRASQRVWLRTARSAGIGATRRAASSRQEGSSPGRTAAPPAEGAVPAQAWPQPHPTHLPSAGASGPARGRRGRRRGHRAVTGVAAANGRSRSGPPAPDWPRPPPTPPAVPHRKQGPSRPLPFPQRRRPAPPAGSPPAAPRLLSPPAPPALLLPSSLVQGLFFFFPFTAALSPAFNCNRISSLPALAAISAPHMHRSQEGGRTGEGGRGGHRCVAQ